MQAIIDAIKTKKDLDLKGVKVVYFKAVNDIENYRQRLEHTKIYVDDVLICSYIYPLFSVDAQPCEEKSTRVNDIISACKVALEWKVHIDAMPCDIRDEPLKHHKLGLTYTASGYGRKIPTRYKAYYKGIWRRIYSVCYSNVSSEYIEVNGKTIPVFL